MIFCVHGVFLVLVFLHQQMISYTLRCALVLRGELGLHVCCAADAFVFVFPYIARWFSESSHTSDVHTDCGQGANAAMECADAICNPNLGCTATPTFFSTTHYQLLLLSRITAVEHQVVYHTRPYNTSTQQQ